MDIPVVLDLRQLRKDAESGRVSLDCLLDIIERQQQTIQRLQGEGQRLKERLAQYEPATAAEGTATVAADAGSASYSMEAESKRRRHRQRRHHSPGRQATEIKFATAGRFQDIYPEGVDHRVCRLVRERAVWRIEDGKAVRVGYRIFAGPDGHEPSIPGVTPRCEYGIEVLVVLAFLVYLIGMSLDKACAVMHFFCQLPLEKSEADALLRQLANHWQGEFDLLCSLLAEAAIVYMDETGWKIGNEGCSLWAFASRLQRVFVFGCRKDSETLEQILPRDKFQGIGVSDDGSVYAERFQRGQKCWAHLLRKAIKLALLYPEEKRYQSFLDELLKLYGFAKRAAADGRLGEAGRRQRVSELEERLAQLAQPHLDWEETTATFTPHENDFVNLVHELVRLARAEELFTFVLEPAVDSTNNLVERELRSPASDRDAGRTNKTTTGARRRSIIVSVLQSLRVNLAEFSLQTVLDEVTRWMKEGISLFAKQWQAVQAAKLKPELASG